MCNLVGDTISAFAQAGAPLYNHGIMMLPLNTLPMRAPGAFKSNAKLGMCHQHVLVFYKGKTPNRDVRGLQLTNADRLQEWK